MEIIKLNTELDKFYKPWAKVKSFPLPDGKHFITKDLLDVGYLAGIEDDVEPIKDSETDIFDMPAMGEVCTEDVVYKFVDGEEERLVICRQTHNRTEHDPSTIPALFTFFRENSDDLEWIPNELVETGWKRVHDGTTYECIQGHMTVVGQTPDLTPALWNAESSGISVWVQPTGGHDAYNIGDQVYFPTENDSVYESLIDANVWSPTVYHAGWEEQ